jgi:hypothetical protein
VPSLPLDQATRCNAPLTSPLQDQLRAARQGRGGGGAFFNPNPQGPARPAPGSGPSRGPAASPPARHASPLQPIADAFTGGYDSRGNRSHAPTAGNGNGRGGWPQASDAYTPSEPQYDAQGYPPSYEAAYPYQPPYGPAYGDPAPPPAYVWDPYRGVYVPRAVPPPGPAYLPPGSAGGWAPSPPAVGWRGGPGYGTFVPPGAAAPPGYAPPPAGYGPSAAPPGQGGWSGAYAQQEADVIEADEVAGGSVRMALMRMAGSNGQRRGCA